ncbi:MAG: hypothetical protein AMXMBFR47_00150 [Planctomycetota bacterium]
MRHEFLPDASASASLPGMEVSAGASPKGAQGPRTVGCEGTDMHRAAVLMPQRRCTVQGG